VKTHLVDTNATNETAALFYNLKKLSKTHFAIGQQDAFTGFYQDVTGSSDIKKSTGFDPALLGSDFLFITDKNNNGQANNWFYQQEVKTRTAVIDAYNKGMINIFCWHLREPNREDSFYASDMSETEKNTAFRSILPGGAKHEWYKLKLDKVASVISNLKGSDGKLIPVIFRPFHEFDGSWFWWGANFCTPEEFKTGFKFTVDYLKKTKGVHNILYSFGPDNSYDTEAKYLSRYPGDDYVDILGIDDYGDFNTNSGITGSNRANVKLKVISDLAKARGKIAALTETGYRVNSTTPPINGWFSNFLYNALTANDIEIAFVMLWVNSTNSYYVPTPSAPNVQDFLDFTNKPKSVLVNKLPSMYTIAD
jgi:mannan endo-1,4-beta-mannosidase